MLENNSFYFLKDEFFDAVGETTLMDNTKENGNQRPHYFVFKENKTNLSWVIPISKQIKKYKNIIEKQTNKNIAEQKNYLITVQLIKVQNVNSALLYQDMFPITDYYIKKQYIRGSQPYSIYDPSLINEIKKKSIRTIQLLNKSICLSPFPKNINKIKNFLFTDEKSISYVIEQENFKPNTKLINSFKDLNILNKKFHSLKEINQKYISRNFKSSNEKKLIDTIGNEFSKQKELLCVNNKNQNLPGIKDITLDL